MVIITLVALSVVVIVVAAAADASVAVSVQRGNDTFLVDLVLRYWRWCGLAVLTDLFRLVGLRRLPLGLCVRVGLRLPGFVLASDESGLELGVVVTVLETGAERVREAELLALLVQEVVGNSGWKISRVCCCYFLS